MEKKFNNVFELLAEAVDTARKVEMRCEGGDWIEATKYTRYHLDGILELFNCGRLRLKPKVKKTVEGWVLLTPGTAATPYQLPVYSRNHYVYKNEDCVPGKRQDNDIIAKITFEVEE